MVAGRGVMSCERGRGEFVAEGFDVGGVGGVVDGDAAGADAAVGAVGDEVRRGRSGSPETTVVAGPLTAAMWSGRA